MLLGAAGGRFKTSKGILENLGNGSKKKKKFENFRVIRLFTGHGRNIPQAEPLTKRFFLPTKSGLCRLT